MVSTVRECKHKAWQFPALFCVRWFCVVIGFYFQFPQWAISVATAGESYGVERTLQFRSIRFINAKIYIDHNSKFTPTYFFYSIIDRVYFNELGMYIWGSFICFRKLQFTCMQWSWPLNTLYAFETAALWVFLMGIIYESSLSFYCHKVALFSSTFHKKINVWKSKQSSQ